MPSRGCVVATIIVLMSLLVYPLASILRENEINVYELEIANAYSSEGDSICRWGLSRQQNGEIPLAGDLARKTLLSNGGMYVGDINEKNIYLTFDEGYENGYTESILDTLKEKNVKAIFFITGDYFEKNSHIIRRMLEEGHYVGNHSMNHYSMPELSYEKCESELLELDMMFSEKFGEHMFFFRPPRGEFNNQVLEVARNLNYKCIMWSFAYEDWLTDSQKGTDYAFDMITKNFHNGAILLLHAVSKDNAEVLADVIDEARKQGYEFGSPEEMI